MLSPTERAMAMSKLSPSRLRNILAFLADEAESDGRLATIDTLIRLRDLYDDTPYPDPAFIKYAKTKLGIWVPALTPASREQSSDTQTLHNASDEARGRQSTEPGEIKTEQRHANLVSPKKYSGSPRSSQGETPNDKLQVPHRKHDRSPLSHKIESPAKIRHTLEPQRRLDIIHTKTVAVRHLGYGSWYEDYDCSVAIDEENMLVVYPKPYPDALTGEVYPRHDAFWRTPVSRVYRILRGEGGCAKIILYLSHSRGGLDNVMLLELQSAIDVSAFTALIQEVAVKKLAIMTQNSAVLDSEWDGARQRLQ